VTFRKRTRSALYALAAETHWQASIPLTKWSLWHQAMADDNFGGMAPSHGASWRSMSQLHTSLGPLASSCGIGRGCWGGRARPRRCTWLWAWSTRQPLPGAMTLRRRGSSWWSASAMKRLRLLSIR
jgi:hypothetical protein